MNFNPFNKLVNTGMSSLLLIGMTLLSSCSKDEDSCFSLSSTNYRKSIQTANKNGRFDNVPFQWDYHFSTNPLSNLSNGFVLYPVNIAIRETSDTRSVINGNGRNNNTGRNDTKDSNSHRRSGDTSYPNSTSSIFINQPEIIYVGAAFPEADFGRTFSNELVYPRNPIEISTSFPNSFIGEITKETGGIGYKLFLKDLLKSDEYKSFIKKGMRESLDFQCTEYFSYADIEKAFSANAGLAKVFSTKVQSKTHKTNIKSKLLGQLISRNFTITMELPPKGLFKDQTKNTSPENPVYVRTLSYGKIALLSIESEYSFEEVKQAIEAGIKWKIVHTGSDISAKNIEILQKSTITLYLIADDTNGEGNHFFDSLDDIKQAFQINYSDGNIGLPIFCKGYYTKDNTLFTLSEKNNNQNFRNSDINHQRYNGNRH